MRGGCGRWGCCSSTWPSWRSSSRTRAPASRSPRSRRSAGSAVSRDRLESLAALAVATPVAGLVALWAFSRPALTDDLQAYADRVDDGAWFGVLLAAGAAVAAGVAYWLAGRALSDRERTVWTRRLGWLAGIVALAAVAVVLAVKGGAILDEFRGTGGKEVSQTPTRLAELSSSNRWRWWQEAWSLWKDAPLGGKGAATFEIARRDIRAGLDHHDGAAQRRAPVPGRDRDRRLPAPARRDRDRGDGGGLRGPAGGRR